MVENSEDTAASPRKADWPALYERWCEGEPAARLAADFNLQEKTIADRCRWLDNMFRRDDPAILRFRFTRRLHDAEAALDDGSVVEAERKAKALIALIRAARALQDWCEPEPAASAAQEAASEPFDAKAALKRALFERFKQERDRRSS